MAISESTFTSFFFLYLPSPPCYVPLSRLYPSFGAMGFTKAWAATPSLPSLKGTDFGDDLDPSLEVIGFQLWNRSSSPVLGDGNARTHSHDLFHLRNFERR